MELKCEHAIKDTSEECRKTKMITRSKKITGMKHKK